MTKLASALDDPCALAGGWHHEQTAHGLALSVVWAAVPGAATNPVADAALLHCIDDPAKLLA